MGAQEMTRHGMGEDDFRELARLVAERGIEVTIDSDAGLAPGQFDINIQPCGAPPDEKGAGGPEKDLPGAGKPRASRRRRTHPFAKWFSAPSPQRSQATSGPKR